MTERTILEETGLLEIFESPHDAEEALLATLIAVGAHTPTDDRRAMADMLPSSIGNALLSPDHRGPPTGDTVYGEVAAVCGIPMARACEVVETVIETLAHRLPLPLRQRLARHGGPELGPLWTRRPRAVPPPYYQRRPPPAGFGHTPATSRPGPATSRPGPATSRPAGRHSL